jgi:capsular polysaccharide transport system permease protein
MAATPQRPLSLPLRPRPAPPGASCARAVGALMLREMATRYVRTPGGFLWSVVEPVAAVLVLTFALSLVVHAPSLGTSFVVFYASGYLPFLLFSTLQGHVQQALRFSRPLLAYPSVAWIDAIIARFALNLVAGLAVTSVVLAGLAMTTGEIAVVRPGALLLALGLAALLGLGIGVLNCLMVGLFPVWGQVWAIVSRPLFLVAGVIFVLEDLPQRLAEVLWLTPWIHLSGLFRSGLYAEYAPEHVFVPLVLGWSLVPLVLGLALLRRHAEEILRTG